MTKNYFLAILLAVSLLPLTAFANHGWGPRPGDTVWTESGLEGVVEAMFPDGRVSVKINYSNYVYDRMSLATRGCYRGLCSDQEVITRSGLRGRVNGVYGSGAYSVKINYSNYKYGFEDLASTNPGPGPGPGPGPHPGMQIGETVWTQSGLEGKVAGFFPSGEVSVTINYSQYKYDRSQLATRGCVYQLCSGNNVITKSGLRGTVNGVYPDYRVSVKINYSNYAYDYSQLARTR